MKKTLAVTLVSLFACVASAYDYFITSGDYRITISEKFKHTIRGIVWKNFQIGTPTGYYGAIVVPRPGKFIGAGHTEGGAEKILSVKVTCDGREVIPASRMTIKGKKITVEKISMFDKLLFNIRLELTPQGLVETKRFIATADQDIHYFYAHIYCFNKSFTDYYALTDTGNVISGKFALPKHKRMPKDPKDRLREWHVSSTVKYVSEYDAAAKKGVVLYYPEIIPGKSRKSTFWEVPYAYMKYYMITDVPKLIPAAWESPNYTVVVCGFESDSVKNMPQAVKEAAAEAAKIKFDLPDKPVIPVK